MGIYITTPIEKECIFCKEKFIAQDKRFTRCNKKHTYTCKIPECNKKYEIECIEKNYPLFHTKRHNFCEYHRIYNIKKECKGCGDIFYAQNKTYAYCNKEKKKICKECNKEFTYVCSINGCSRIFCSHQCQINNLHKNYDMKEHNKKLWSNPDHREKVSNTMKKRIITEEQKNKMKRSQTLTEDKIEQYNNMNKDFIFFDKYAKYNRGRLLKQYLLYNPNQAFLYIYSFKNKPYIKIGAGFNDTRLEKWIKEGGKLEYLIRDEPLYIINVEALIHSSFDRVWQKDFIDGKTEFHRLQDKDNIILYLKELDFIFSILRSLKMSKFTKPLKVEMSDNGKYFTLLESFEYYRENNKNEVIKVNAGEISNLCSIPRIFWSIYPPQGGGTKKTSYGPSGFLHDSLYDKGYQLGYSRKECDKIFLESMKAVGVGFLTRWIFYICVRLFAKSHYRRK